MFCSRCGKEVDSGARYCKYCGYDLMEGSEAVPSDIATPSDSNIATPASATLDISDSDNVVIESNADTATSSQSDTADEVARDISSAESETPEPSDNIGKKISRRKRIRKEREIEDARALDSYTIRDDMVSSAEILPEGRLSLKEKGSLGALKTKEIVYIVLCAIVMVVSAVVIGYIRGNNIANEDTLSWLVVVGYLLFFVVFFALAIGIDRVYNLLTLGELATRRITLKKYGFGLTPLLLRDGKVFALDIVGECDQCSGENKGTYHIEWQGDELIAVCNFDRHHLYRIDKEALLGGEDATEDSTLS